MTSLLNLAASAAMTSYASVQTNLMKPKPGMNFIFDIIQVLEQHISDEHFGLPQLCREIGLSRSQLFRKMKAKGIGSPSDLIRSYRLQKAKLMLENTDLQVAEVAWEVGFKDAAHFTRAFKKEFGLLPKMLRK